MRRIFSALFAFLLLGGTMVAQSSALFESSKKVVDFPQSANFVAPEMLNSASQRSIVLPELKQTAPDSYFGFCNRAATDNRFVGTGEAGFIGGAILLPNMPGNEIRGIKFAVESKASRKASAYIVAYNTKDPDAVIEVVAAKHFTATQGLNQVAFDTPYEVPAGHLILVGYQIESVKGQEGGFPIVVDNEPLRAMYSDFAIFEESLLKKGDELKKFSRYDGALGNMVILVDINDKTNKLASFLRMTRAGITSDKPNANGEIAPDKQIGLTLFISNLGRSNVTKIEGFMMESFSENSKRTPFTLSVDIPAQSVATVSLPTSLKTVKRGLGVVGIAVEKYNEVETKTMLFPEQQAQVLTYKVPTPNGAIPRNSILFERFTTEKCVNCPPADVLQEQFIERFSKNPAYKDIKPSLLIHHAGFYTDFLTLKESEAMIPYAFVQGSFAPAFMCNRVATPRGLVSVFDEDLGEIEEVVKKIVSTQQPVQLKTVNAKIEDDKLSLSVEGWAGSVLADQLYFTAVLTENNIAPRSQSGVASYRGKGPFMHQAVARQFFTAFNGDPVTMGSDGKFTFKLDKVALKNKGWKKEDLKLVIFAHHNMKFPAWDMREVFASMTLDYNTLTATLDILPEDVPAVSVYNGYLTVTGAAQGVEVFDMSGRLVSTSIAKQLSRGVYVVKVSTAHGPFTHKVVVE